MSRNQLPVVQLNKKSLDSIDANTKAVRELAAELKRQRIRAVEGAGNMTHLPSRNEGESGGWTGGVEVPRDFTEHVTGGDIVRAWEKSLGASGVSLGDKRDDEDIDLVEQAYERGRRDAVQAAAFNGALHPGNQGLAAGNVHPGIRHGGHEETLTIESQR